MMIFLKRLPSLNSCASLKLRICTTYRSVSSQQQTADPKTPLRLFGIDYQRDDWTNISPTIIEKLDRKLLLTRYHPLNHLMSMIKYYFYKNYTQSGSPLFSVYDNFSPVVSVEQNFDRYYIRK